MKKNIWTILVALIVVAMIAAACGTGATLRQRAAGHTGEDAQ